uniref:Uncharacterized protein n=1 Tax=Hanusia phi TaxID=3032 RepID=A0A7S0EEM4_9CRYP|mmetsp:Transcript_22399/g.50480  ORF Transcript_22399/g.50480 Transcript_22399/m.50480 type:complete len:613 (+) Transcript_22399:2-1840(+)
MAPPRMPSEELVEEMPSSAVLPACKKMLSTPNEASSFIRRSSIGKTTFHDGTKNASFASLFYCSRPLEAALTRPVFQLVFAVIAVQCFHICYCSSEMVEGIKDAQMMRFTALELRGGYMPSYVKISSIGVRLSGSEVPWNQVSQEGSAVTIDFGRQVSWDSWYFNTSTESTGLDPVRFYVEQWNGETGGWTMIGSSSYVAYLNTFIFLHGRFETSKVRGMLHEFRLENASARLQWWTKGIYGILSFAIAIAGMIGKESLGKDLFKFLYFISFCLYFWCWVYIWYAEAHLKGDNGLEIYFPVPLTWLVGFMLIGCFEQEYIVHSIQIQCIFVVWGIHRLGGHPYYGKPSPHLVLMYCGVVLTSLAVLIPAFRILQLQKAKHQIMPDKLKYDYLWLEYSSKHTAALEQLEYFIRKRWGSSSGDLRQYLEHDHASPCKLLSDLYVHNDLAIFVLRSCILRWGANSDGELRSQAEAKSYVKAKHVESVATTKVQWAPVKKKRRVVEKAIRVHGGDLSRVLDVLRECLVFERVEDLSRCLEEISQDDGVEVVRVKNRLSENFDANSTAGYRDVLVNLRVQGFFWKVMEVQLVLKDFDKLKSKEGHQRYVAYRNSLCV